MDEDYRSLAEEIIKASLSKGADTSDIMIAENLSKNIGCRLGNIEEIEQSETRILGLRAFVGNRNAIISTNDFSQNSINESIDRVISMAKLAPEDPLSKLASETIEVIPDLELFDDYDLNPNDLKDLALKTEESALKAKGVTNSNGASSSQSKTSFCLSSSNGFSGVYKKSNFSISCSAIAGDELNMQTDYEYDSRVFFEDLKDASLIGKQAAENTVSKCNPKKIETCKSDVVFDPRVSRTLLAHFASLVNGASIARGSSFLSEKMNTKIFNKEINIIDNPSIPRGLGSKPFDDEGCEMKKLNIVENGTLKSWFLDNTTAQQLGIKSNNRASRGMSSPPSPSPTNMFIENGSHSKDRIINNIKDGFYVTDLIGQGVNLITGDYSRGAGGFKIENGEISFPINEVTIAGNLKDMFNRMIVANDLEFKYSLNSPTILIEGMIIAGV